MSRNHVTLAQLDEKVIRDLPIDQIELLLEEITLLKSKVKSYDNIVSTEMARRFAEKAAEARRLAGKDTGTVRINCGEHVIVSDLPKVVDWDQAQLAFQFADIEENWIDAPTDYISVKYSVDERKFSSWPASLQKTFLDARTVTTGKATFRIEARKDAA